MGETGVWVEKSNYPFELIKVDNGKVAAVSAARAPAAGAPPPPPPRPREREPGGVAAVRRVLSHPLRIGERRHERAREAPPRPVVGVAAEENSFLTYGGNGVRHMGEMGVWVEK